MDNGIRPLYSIIVSWLIRNNYERISQTPWWHFGMDTAWLNSAVNATHISQENWCTCQKWRRLSSLIFIFWIILTVWVVFRINALQSGYPNFLMKNVENFACTINFCSRMTFLTGWYFFTCLPISSETVYPTVKRYWEQKDSRLNSAQLYPYSFLL